MTGDLQVEAQLCLSMREAGVVVVDVDYRLCPGKFPNPSTAPWYQNKSKLLTTYHSRDCMGKGFSRCLGGSDLGKIFFLVFPRNLPTEADSNC